MVLVRHSRVDLFSQCRTPPPTEHLEAQGKRPPKIVFEEDEFIEEYYRRHPAATLEPIDLGSFYPPVAKQFAYRAVQLMEEHGMSRAEAKEQAYKDVSSQEQSLSVGERLIAKIQDEEGIHLKEAMETFRKNHENDLQSLIDA